MDQAALDKRRARLELKFGSWFPPVAGRRDAVRRVLSASGFYVDSDYKDGVYVPNQVIVFGPDEVTVDGRHWETEIVGDPNRWAVWPVLFFAKMPYTQYARARYYDAAGALIGSIDEDVPGDPVWNFAAFVYEDDLSVYTSELCQGWCAITDVDEILRLVTRGRIPIEATEEEVMQKIHACAVRFGLPDRTGLATDP